MLDQICNVYVGSNISNRLYSINDLVWPNTTGNLWGVIDNPYNKTISNFNVTYAGGQVDVNWGAAISGNVSSNTNINHTFSGITRSGISVIPKNGANITKINCGTSSPKLSGTISLSAFPNLQDFRCINNDITAITGYLSNPNITWFELSNNKLTGSIPNFTTMTNLQFLLIDNNLFTGSFPSLPSSINYIGLTNNKLTGTIPNLNSFTSNNFTYLSDNQFTGSIPLLQIGIQDFVAERNQLTGTIPSLNSYFNLRNFLISSNKITGSIPSLNNNTNLRNFSVVGNPNITGTFPSLTNNTLLTNVYANGCSLQGAIPDLSNNVNLIYFNVATQLGATKINAWTGGTVSNKLGEFFAQNNQLTSSAVNSILAAFVAANKIGGTLNLGGAGNFAPVGQGINDVATLRSRSWVVTTGVL